MLQDTVHTRSMWACTCPEDVAIRSVVASIIMAERELQREQEPLAALAAVQAAEIASVTSNRKWNVQVGGVASPRPKPDCEAGQRVA